MKKMLLLSFFFAAISQVSFAQNEALDENLAYGVRWGIGVYKPGSIFEGYPGKPVAASIMYKDSSGTVIYTETHAGTLDDFSFLRFIIGQGLVPQPPERLKPSDYQKVRKLCWTATVEGMSIEGMDDITSVPKANFAYHASNSERLGGALFNDSYLGLDELVDPPPTQNIGFNAWVANTVDENHEIRPVRTWDFVRTDPTVSAVTGNPLKAVRIGKGSFWPFVFGASTPGQLENLYTVCVPPLVNYRHGMGVKVAGPHSPINHNTAAIYADNTESEMSAGVLASAQTWGIYGSAQNGVVGITNGVNNGTGLTGFVGQAPDTGGFKYAAYANANGQPNSWAAALFGNSFYTGTLTMSSDARLKTGIRSQSNALEKVMQLKPSQYLYRQDTPYSLPDGLHHGFLAQDVEAIFPELVSDITMPLSLDPQEIYKSETTEYKGINYIEMIAILTSAMQEMNAKIDAQAKEIAELQKALQNVNGQK